MQQLTISASPASVGALSVWSGYEGAYGEVRYSAASADGGYVTFTLPPALSGARFSQAHLGYTLSGGGGTRHIRFAGGASEATDARILERLQQGETEIRLYFSFRAAGASGGEGSHSLSATWSDIRLDLVYEPAGAVTGQIDLGASGSLGYSFDRRSLLIGDSAVLTLNAGGVAGLRSVTAEVGGGENEAFDTVALPAQAENGLVRAAFTLTNATWQGRTANAYLRLRLRFEGGEQATGWTATGLILCQSCLAPAVGCAFSDESGVCAQYGCFVQGKSRLKANLSATLDTAADPAASVTGRELTFGERAYTSGTNEFDLGEVRKSGLIPYSVRVTDSFGQEGSAAGTVNVVPYAAPKMTELRLERYGASVNGQGQTVYEPDDGSPNVRLTAAGRVSAVNGQNAWTLRANYTDGTSSGQILIASGADGGAIFFDGDRSVFPVPLSETSDWTVSFTLTDGFETVEYGLTVPRAGGIFNIEHGGVAIGMRSTGTRALPRFEVACPATFYGEVAFPGIDSGWQPVTFSGASEYGADWPVRARMIGGTVFLRGGVKLNQPLPSGAAGSVTGEVMLLSLPAGFWPTWPMEFPVVPDRSDTYLHLRIDIDGSVKLYNRSGYQVGVNTLIPVNLCFLRD